MTENEKIELLKKVLKDNGLNFDDPEINKYFTEQRLKTPIMIKDDMRTGESVKYSHSALIRPTIKTIEPLEVENAYYAQTNNLNTLLDWYLYKNYRDNPLVFENLGKDIEELRESFLQANIELDEDVQGNLFNGEDGNHRMLAMLINNFIEASKAKTDEESQAVSDKYEFDVPVNLAHKKMLCDALAEEYECVLSLATKDEERLFPMQVCSYRRSTFKTLGEKDYLVDFDFETGKYTYEFNFDKFVGTAEELTGWLITKQKNVEPIMKWEADGMFYLSCNNQVWKSADAKEIEQLSVKVRESFRAGKIAKNNFLEIKDLDSNTYGFEYSGMLAGVVNNAAEVASFWDFVLKSRPEKVLFHKLKGAELVEASLKKSVHDSRYLNMDFLLPDFNYENLTHDEYVKVKKLFESFELKLATLKNNPVEV